MFRKVTLSSATEDIIKQIMTAINNGSLAEDSRMPSERQLAEQFQVSRATIREALRHLIALGYVETRRGLGTYVHPARTSFPESEMNPEMLMEARLAIEPYLVQLCTLRATSAEIERLGAILDKVESDKSNFETYDNEFHYAIAMAGKNSILIKTAEGIYRARSGNLWGTLKARSLTEEHIEIYQKQHRNILNAIMERHAELAESELRHHLQTTCETLFGAWPRVLVRQ